MWHKKTMMVAALTAATLALSGCSVGGSSASSTDESTDGTGKTLTIWAMQGDYSTQTLNAINSAFTKKTGAKVKVETQQWTDITTKITTALTTSTPPDVLDIGNTQVAGFATSGGLLDVSSHKKELSEGNEWLSGLEDPATVGGKLYGVPAFGAARAVVYNKKIWADAGVTSEPTTWDEFTADLDKVAAKNASNADFTPFYLPGQYWYSMLQFVWDAGGQVAQEKDGKWTGTMSNAKSVKGLEEWKAFQNKYSSKASQSLDTDSPDQNQMLADGTTSAVLANSAALSSVKTINSSVSSDDLGTFAMPGQSGKNQPAMTAGSDWTIASKSKNSGLALEWIKIASSSDIQQKWVFGHDGWLPNTVEGLDKAMKSSSFPEAQKGFFEAAKDSKATPGSANWATIEGDKSVNSFTQSIATGTATPAQAAKSFDEHMDEVFAK
ncbi:extracellular solute-binding protein [Bifidobacterium sp.]|uniref:extracellular solute-binding protein n=1 Tax=Bifidobacterium sp. TaxID=41200 RepID=UPI0025C24632|nr:extracellular solute-binding protein [Bifidobacterium sp.]MCH4160576.1 extracellular solute-binding protein [Bifidobacterium sp.]MCH4174682.1 extracellular solute-binding protein [Bifidobacterium sp.]MCI1636093.1 extracellular solute-binding protein [Bifidobacterium sp.]